MLSWPLAIEFQLRLMLLFLVAERDLTIVPVQKTRPLPQERKTSIHPAKSPPPKSLFQSLRAESQSTQPTRHFAYKDDEVALELGETWVKALLEQCTRFRLGWTYFPEAWLATRVKLSLSWRSLENTQTGHVMNIRYTAISHTGLRVENIPTAFRFFEDIESDTGEDNSKLRPPNQPFVSKQPLMQQRRRRTSAAEVSAGERPPTQIMTGNVEISERAAFLPNEEGGPQTEGAVRGQTAVQVHDLRSPTPEQKSRRGLASGI
ncbi:hypothetical protein EDD18DRAFT_1112460 [Armillaria luteobubalina]|uniref:Uncharacterized protein n=1 Tax=Armillaria luteobubalina TaxID=153913 RepID=A0AA39PFK8_9AGAR|nr:hypothetical protein EDD18DRAFT_1112460 [Armillaria luteobubalina]